MNSIANHLRITCGLDPIELLLLTMSLAEVLSAAVDDERETMPPPMATEEGEG